MFLISGWYKNLGAERGASDLLLARGGLLLLLARICVLLCVQTPGCEAQQPPSFIKNMDMYNVKENTPVNELVYRLEADVDRKQLPPGTKEVHILYAIEGTSLFSVNKVTGDVMVAQTLDREQTGGEVRFQVLATAVYHTQSSPPGSNQLMSNVQYGPQTRLSITVIILDENDNPPRLERVRAFGGRLDLDAKALSQLAGGQQRVPPLVRLSLSESTPVDSLVLETLEASDVDKASSTPLTALCLDCDSDFRLENKQLERQALNDKLNYSLVLSSQLVHVPRANVRQLHLVVTDGKFNSSLVLELTVLDVQNKPPQFLGPSSCVVQENLPIDRTVMLIQAIDGDALGQDEVAPVGGPNQPSGRPIIYDLLTEPGDPLSQDFKLHPLTGQLQVANRLDREAHLATNDVLSLRVRARELTVSWANLTKPDDLYESIIEQLQPYVDPSPDASSELELRVILVDVNDNEPHWLNASEISALNINQSPDWFASLPQDRADTSRVYQLEVRENSPPGTPISFKNQMFVYDLDNGHNANFNISLVDHFNLFDVEPKQVSGFALVTLKLAAGVKRRPLDYENPNERRFIIELLATETSTAEHFRSVAQVHVNVLDVNDNAPEFKEVAYHANIREDAPPGKTVLLVQARDKDEVSRQLHYSLHGRSAHLFDINRQSGLVTVARCPQETPLGGSTVRVGRAGRQQCIDYETQRAHHLMVEASDGELSSKVPLTVFVDDASDNAPVFSLPVLDVVIEEGAERLEPPIRVEASDADASSVLSYSIVEGNFEALFSINNATGELQLTRPIRVAHEPQLDAPSGDSYRQHLASKITLIVQATDGQYVANGTVRIDVLDANDNAPQFVRPRYEVELAESASAGQQVALVMAVDADRGNNARVSYRIQRGSYGQFEIDENTGNVTVSRQARPFDFTRRQNYTLEVAAHDHGLIPKSSIALVYVRLVETVRRAPEFAPQIQRVSIPESTLNNTIIHRMQVQDQEQVANLMLIFEPGPIEALDKNGQPVSLSDNERLESMFSVSTNTGDVIVSSALDHEQAAYMNLTIYVSSRHFNPAAALNASAAFNEADSIPIDQFNPRSVGYLIINVMDDNTNAPVFATPWSAQQPELSFQMLEELPVGSVLTQLMASDADSKISHFKVEPPNEYFELSSPQSGVLVNKRLIDYDTLMSQTFLTPNSAASRRMMNLTQPQANSKVGNNIIQFNVFVYDSGTPQLSAKAIVSVEVLPVNDWDCRFETSMYEVHLRENAAADTLVVQVRANDLDYGEQHNSLRYQLVGEHADFFNIDQRTGLVTVSKKGSNNLDRERLPQSTLAISVVARDGEQQQANFASPGRLAISGRGSQPPQAQNSRSCSANIKVHVDDVNDNPPLFTQKHYDVTAYDTDSIQVPIARLLIRDDDSLGASNNQASAKSTNSFKIVSGNVNDSFNVTSTGLIYVTKPLNDSLVASKLGAGPIQLRVQVRQQSTDQAANSPAAFTDECTVRVHFVKINRFGPEWRFGDTNSAGKKFPISIRENSPPNTLITQLKCIDRDYELRSPNNRLFDFSESEHRQISSSGRSNLSPIRYWIKENGSNVIENNEFKVDPVTGNLSTRVSLDREQQEFYQLIVVCEDNGRPQSLENVTPLLISVLDEDDNKPEFIVSKSEASAGPKMQSGSSFRARVPMISFSIEEHQSKGLPVGEVRALDRDLEGSYSISYCLIEGNEFQEFSLDPASGILYTNQTLDRERQSTYELLIKAINDGSSCEAHMITSSLPAQISSTAYNLSVPQQSPNQRAKRSTSSQQQDGASLLTVRVDVLDINDNPPVFKKSTYRAGVHHRALMSTLITQVNAFDPDLGANGTLGYKITEILMYKSTPTNQYQSARAKYDVSMNEQVTLSKPIKLIQYPFKIDQQGNVYTQQLLTQYQLMSMFVLTVEASEQAEPWRSTRTKLELYVYETSNQLKIRINLHPRLVETYRAELETLLSNATKYTAIINRARSYHETSLDNSNNQQKSAQSNKPNNKQLEIVHNSVPSTSPDIGANNNNEPSFSNIHLIFVDNFRIVNPNLVMEKFDLTSAQLFIPQIFSQQSPNQGDGLQQQIFDNNNQQQVARQQLQVNEVSSLIDKIALASVQAAEYHSSASSMAGIDWLESPSVLYVTMTIVLFVVGFVTFLFGCCCTSRIKDHIVKVAMDKLVKQQNLQAKINEQVLAATNQAAPFNATNGGRASSTGQDFILQQGGFMSSFDATKSCVINNTDNMNMLQRVMESGEYIDPNYTTLNSGHVNLGAHYYDENELEQNQLQQDDFNQHQETGGASKQLQQHNGSTDSLSIGNGKIGHEDLVDKDLNHNNQLVKNGKLLNNGKHLQQQHLQQHHNARQRQQIPSDH